MGDIFIIITINKYIYSLRWSDNEVFLAVAFTLADYQPSIGI